MAQYRPGVTTYKPTNTPQQTVPPSNNWRTLLLIVALVGVALAAVASVAYLTYFKPRGTFSPEIYHYEYSRNALTGEMDTVNVDEIFSPARIKEYRENGSGYEVTFRVNNDPRNEYHDTTKTCSLEKWNRFAQTSNPKRRALVDSKRQEFEKCVAWFAGPIPITRSVEIGLDDTEGVDPKLREFVRTSLADAKLVQDLVSTKDTVRLYVFRLTEEDFLSYRHAEFGPGTTAEQVQSKLDELLSWLLEIRKATKESSIATGLFNALALNKDLRQRKIFVFTDGMENSRRTTTFYPALRDRAFFAEDRWGRLDSLIARQMKFPDLHSTQFLWVSPPIPGAYIRAAQGYWKHVLVDRCHVPASKIEMIY